MVSFVIPTLNSAKTLELCLRSITSQDLPRDSYEIVIADAGSTDNTLEIARACGADTITENPLKTGEAGKSAGIKAAQGDLIALVDSDNILPDSHWLTRMCVPFRDPHIIASDPLYYVSRPQDPALTRYFSLLGMSDPICLFTGNYDRISAITGEWTALPVPQRDRGSFLELTLSEDALPTIGANGFIFRRTLLDHVEWDPYFFDIDVVHQAVLAGHNRVAKAKVGIVHLYCFRLRDFARKQQRRIRDFLYYSQSKQRTYPWRQQRGNGILWFVLATITTIPLIIQMIIGHRRSPDRAWLYHIPVCWITLWVYGWATLRKAIGFKQAPVERSHWQKVP